MAMASEAVVGDGDVLVKRRAWRILAAVFISELAVGWSAWLAVSSTWPTPLWGAISAGVAAAAPLFVTYVHNRVVALEIRDASRELPTPNTPAGLLRADRHIVPFTGRTRELAELRDWCRDDNPPIRLLVGAAGVGKTRLALHLGDYLKSVGWSIMVVGAGREAEALTILRGAAPHSSLLLIVDYAETRSGLVELLRSVAFHAGRVRVLLIARSAGDWWWQLGSDVPAVQKLIQMYPPLELSAPVDSLSSPIEFIHTAIPCFAKELRVRAPTKIDIMVPVGDAPMLALHAAALLAVLRSTDREAPAEQLMADIGVLKELLGHERRFWVHSAQQMNLDLDPVVLERVVAVACLFGAVDETDGAEILRRVPDLHDASNERRRRVARWFRRLYPSGIGYWGTLQPELVSEAHVIEQLRNCPELIMIDLSTLRINQVHRMLTVLSMGVTYQPASARLLEQIVRADIEQLVFPALDVAKVTGTSLGQVLARVLSDTPVTREMLYKIEEKIPYPTTVLAEAAVVVTRRILDTLPEADIVETARWGLRLGVVLAQAGHADKALVQLEAAVNDYCALVEADRERYLPGLAGSLLHLGVQYVEHGRHTDSLPYTQQAVAYYQQLAVNHPCRHRADLAAALSNLGVCLLELGRHSAALEPLQQAVEHYQELIATDPVRYQRDLAQARKNLLSGKSYAPDYMEPLDVLEGAMQRDRTLAEGDRDHYLPELARSLRELGNGYAERDRREEAKNCLMEALHYYRILVEDLGLDRYRPGLAACLNDLGVNFSELRDTNAKLYIEEAIGLFRGLIKINPARFRPELARSLNNLAFCLSSIGKHEESLSPATEAIDLYRSLADIDPDRYRPELAQALTNRSVSLSERHRHAEALPDSRDAVALYWDLYAIDPRKYSATLARALRRLAVDYSSLSRHAEADRCRQDADDLINASDIKASDAPVPSTM
jgi:tetratricopeptide (TPR) repeat protein